MKVLNIEQIEELRKKAEEAKADYVGACTDYAVSNCPYKIGDVVEISGCSHRGKKLRIEKISYRERFSNKEILWKVIGVVLKKDGFDSLYSASFDQSDEKIWGKKVN